MSGFKWKMDGCDFSLKRTEEGNLWKIMKHGHGDAEPTCEGHVIVYVDDIMALANDNVRNSFFDRLKKEWKCSDVETVDKNEWIRFCGFELKRHDDGVSLMVGQKSYTAELLKRHEHVSPKSCPMPKLDSSETDETDITTPDVRAAQAITGELLWLSVRSRPDIAYAVSVMGRNVTRKPRWVQQLGQHVLGFLCNTPETCLLYRPCNKDHGAHGTLQVPRHEKLIEAFADISFAPQGDRSHQGIILCAAGSPIQWEATRQAFHTMSTAESELVGYCEATTMLKSAEALLKVIHGSCNTGDGLDGFEKVIYGDNSSALSILMNPDGGWRTRHLRLRSSCLRELLKSDPQTWKVRHQRGVDLPADMLTKPITLLRDWVKFWHFLGFHVDASIPKYDPENTPQKTSKGSSKTTATSGPDETKGSDDVVTKVKVIVAMAALAVASSAAGRADVRLACATAAAACAGWLACNWHPAPSSEDRSKEICLDGREVEKPSRAIGLKSEKDARGDEPAKEKPPRENEPGGINPQIRTKKCVRSPREDEPGENSFGKVWDRTPENGNWAHRTYESRRDFWDSNPEEGPGFGDFVAGNSFGMAHNSFESVGGDSEDAVEMLQPLLADTYHCPTGCPKVPAVRLAAMAPKMSKPAPPLPPQEPGFAAPKAAPKPAAVRRKAPPMMLQCAAAMGAPSSSSEIRGPYIGALPKFPPARRDAEMAQKAAGGTMLDGMPRHGPWLDSRYLQPNTTGKKDSWSVAKCGEEIFLVKVHKSPRKQRFHPLHRSAPIEAQFLTGERVTKAFFVNPADGVGFLVADRWDDPVVRAESRWIGYTFLTMRREVMEKMNLSIQLEPAATAEDPPWPQTEVPKDDGLDVHVGQHYEMETPRRHRPQQAPGLMVGRLYLDGCLASSQSGTVSSGGSSELRLVPLLEPTSQHNKTSGAPTVGYSRGGVIQRGVAAMPSSTGSDLGSMPKSYVPLTVEWDVANTLSSDSSQRVPDSFVSHVEEWSLLTDPESDDANVNEEEP